MKDIIIFSGQSNMQGQTEKCPEKTAVDRALEYRYLKDELIPLCHPVGEVIDGDLLWEAFEGKGSLIPDFCKSYIAETENDVVAVHAARGATQIFQWQSSHPRFNALVKKCKAAIEAVKKTDQIGKIWFVWLQGESDALAGVMTSHYKLMLKTFKTALLKELPIDGFGLIRVGKFADTAVNRADNDIKIIKAQEELCQEGEFTMLTRVTGECTKEPEKWINPHYIGHYNNAAMTRIGAIAGTNLGRFAKGLAIELEDEPYDEVKL